MKQWPDPAVRDLTASAYTIPTDGPEADGTMSWDSTTVVVVEARAADEHGIGWSYTSAGAVSVVNDLLESAVVGGDALDPVSANDRMSRAVRNVGRRGIASSAISAVDIALWDLKAKLVQQPLSRLLGQVHDRVKIYGSGGFTTYDDERTRAQLEDWIDNCGADSVKIKIGESWGTRIERDLHRAEFAREIIGPDRALFVDANGGYRTDSAITVGHVLDAIGVSWYEEPVTSDDLEGLRTVRRAVRADVTAGEYGWDVGYFKRMVSAEAVDCLQIDVTRCGGITDFLRAAEFAAFHHLEVSAHCAPHVHLPVTAAMPNLRHIEYFHDHVRIEEQMLFSGTQRPRDGALVVNDTDPGIGVELRRRDAEALRVA